MVRHGGGACACHCSRRALRWRSSRRAAISRASLRISMASASAIPTKAKTCHGATPGRAAAVEGWAAVAAVGGSAAVTAGGGGGTSRATVAAGSSPRPSLSGACLLSRGGVDVDIGADWRNALAVSRAAASVAAVTVTVLTGVSSDGGAVVAEAAGATGSGRGAALVTGCGRGAAAWRGLAPSAPRYQQRRLLARSSR